jgi:L-asparaginase
LAKVVVLATGGTISSKHDASRGSAVATANSADMLTALGRQAGGLLEQLTVETEQFCSVGSYLFDLPLAFSIAQRADALLADPDVAGIVVTQGTDTMEESVYMADLVVSSDKPVVFTGAQYLADAPDADGPRNLANAVRLAAAPAARGLGAVIAFDGEVHAARDVTKLHSSRAGAFHSGEHGKLGEIDGEIVAIHRRPTLRETFQPAAVETRVELIRLSMGIDGRPIRSALEYGAKGIVLEAFGRGNATLDVVAAVGEAVAADVPVVITSRCPQGRVKPIYGNGGGRDLEGAGALFAGDLQGAKARILLAVLLGAGPATDVAAAIRRIGG